MERRVAVVAKQAFIVKIRAKIKLLRAKLCSKRAD